MASIRQRKTFEKTRRQIEAIVSEKANRIANEMSSKIVDVFVNRAKARLDRFADDESMNGESASIVRGLKDNIYTEGWSIPVGDKVKVYNIVRVKRDPQNLLMFLEYGTGVAGFYDNHPEAGKNGWIYWTNPKHYKRPIYAINDLRYDGYGWFFNKKPFSFVGRNDHENVVFKYRYKQDVEGYEKTLKSGKKVKVRPYTRKIRYAPDKVVDNAVFTQGIKPVRFLYDTRQEIKGLFGGKQQTLSELNAKIDKLKII